ncbi:hypothetical protein HDU87_001020 [Geranomyces variabilis]|uniref:Uncharacterized protein n=1 Tax=Geranomyces variabilis TaxID=109894 RepID=A0AAD5XU04_9FUNG|nr:hypothetical protein HDU87_001020 [Geranomyces variabilis]
MLSDSVTSSRAGTPMPSVAAVPRRSARYRPDADVLSQCESVATDATEASNASRWSSKSLRFKLRRAGSIRSTSTTQSTHERITALIRHLARSLHVQRKAASPSGASSPFPYATAGGTPQAEHHTPQSRLDDFSVRLGSSAARYGGSNVNAAGVGGSPMRPAGPRRLESEDAAAVWADVMKTAHATKGGAEKAAFHHVLRERDQAVQECRRLKSLRGGKQSISSGQPAVASVRDIHKRLAQSVSELQQVTGRKEVEAGGLTTDLKRIAGELAALTRELEQSLARSSPLPGLAKSAEPSTRIVSVAGPVVPPSPCSQQQLLQTSLSRQSSVHTLSNPFQSNRIPTPATKENETTRAVAAAAELEKKEEGDRDEVHALETAHVKVNEAEIVVSLIGDMHGEPAAASPSAMCSEATPESDKPNHVESQPSTITLVTSASKVDVILAAESAEDMAQLKDGFTPSPPPMTEAWTDSTALSADNLATSSETGGLQPPTTASDLEVIDFADEMNGRINEMFASVAAPVSVPRPPPRKRTIKRTVGAREPSFDLKAVDVTDESDKAAIEAA